jgi:hypothetical protein
MGHKSVSKWRSERPVTTSGTSVKWSCMFCLSALLLLAKDLLTTSYPSSSKLQPSPLLSPCSTDLYTCPIFYPSNESPNPISFSSRNSIGNSFSPLSTPQSYENDFNPSTPNSRDITILITWTGERSTSRCSLRLTGSFGVFFHLCEHFQGSLMRCLV